MDILGRTSAQLTIDITFDIKSVKEKHKNNPFLTPSFQYELSSRIASSKRYKKQLKQGSKLCALLEEMRRSGWVISNVKVENNEASEAANESDKN